MKIDNSARREDKPEFIFSLCRLLGSQSFNREEILRFMIPCREDGQKGAYISQAITFAKNCGMITEDEKGNYRTDFTQAELQTFQRFMYRIFKESAKAKDTDFYKLCQFLYDMQENMIFKADPKALREREQNVLGLNKDDMAGLIQWLIAMDLLTLDVRQSTSAGQANVFFPTLYRPIRHWIHYDQEFPLHQRVSMDQFLSVMKQAFLFLNIDFDEHVIPPQVCLALKILEQSGYIKMSYVSDSTDRWNLNHGLDPSAQQPLAGSMLSPQSDATNIEVLKYE